MEQTKERKREYTYAVMTVITTFLVVLGHIGFSETPNVIISYNQSNGAQHVLNLIIGVIYSFHMPLFFFVSGSVFGYVYNKKPYAFPSLVLKKAQRLIGPFYLTRFLYILPLKLLVGIYAWANLPSLLKRMLSFRDIDHLWFLIILFYTFIIVFPLRKYLFKFKIPILILLLAGLAFYQRVPLPYLINITFAYIVYFYMGLIFNEYNERISTKGAVGIAVVALLAYVAVYFKSELFFGYTNGIVQKGMTLGFNILQAVLGIGFIYGLSKALCAVNIQNTKVFKVLYKHGFKIYLLHSTLNYVLLVAIERYGQFAWVNQSSQNTAAYLLFRLAFTFLVPLIISMGVDWVVRLVKEKVIKKETAE